MTFPKPPFPRNCSSSYSHFTRDFPGTPEKNEKLDIGSSRSGWSIRCDGPSSPAFPLFFPTSCWPFAKLPDTTGVKNECSRNWDADQRFLSSVFKQLWRRKIEKKDVLKKDQKIIKKVRIHILASTLSPPFLKSCATELNYYFKVIANCWSLLCSKNEYTL